LGSGRLTVGLISPADSLGYNRSLPLLAYDPAKAVNLLHQADWRRTPAGWRDRQGKLRKLVVRYGAGEVTYQLLALQLRAASQQMGLGVELHPTPPTLLSQVVAQGEYDVYLHMMRGLPSDLTSPRSTPKPGSRPATSPAFQSRAVTGSSPLWCGHPHPLRYDA
jgi:ABC-type transport system substrate-binding protein